LSDKTSDEPKKKVIETSDEPKKKVIETSDEPKKKVIETSDEPQQPQSPKDKKEEETIQQPVTEQTGDLLKKIRSGCVEIIHEIDMFLVRNKKESVETRTRISKETAEDLQKKAEQIRRELRM
jgi:hypothetical protein